MNYSLFGTCATCRVCAGAGHQGHSMLAAGNPDAPIVIVAQNPGEAKSDDKMRLRLLKVFADEATPTSQLARAVYNVDFSTSYGCKMLGSLLGDDWLDDPRFLFTNAVRCRTAGNTKPSDEMIEKCSVWTRQIVIGRKGLILMGSVAKEQVLGEEAADLPFGEMRKHKTYGVVLSIMHYSAWKGGQAIEYKAKVASMLKELEL